MTLLHRLAYVVQVVNVLIIRLLILPLGNFFLIPFLYLINVIRIFIVPRLYCVYSYQCYLTPEHTSQPRV